MKMIFSICSKNTFIFIIEISEVGILADEKFEKQLYLSKIDDNERAKAEKYNETAELKEQLAQFQIEHNKSELKSVLGSRGLNT